MQMSSHKYVLGPADKIEQLYPQAKYADPNLGLKDYCDVIAHYTLSSLDNDGFKDVSSVKVTLEDDHYHITIEGGTPHEGIIAFGERHAEIFSANCAQKAIRGRQLMEILGVWNPMAGYHVNNDIADGKCKWHLFPPLGDSMISQRGLLMMHYPPWTVIQAGNSNNSMTLRRWKRLLINAGFTEKDWVHYKTVVDVNPVAAPGSGQSEYENDYFPIMMASAFFDGPSDRDYIRSMLDLYLNPPGLPEDRKYTLPLLICGSPLYDPQAPGWFRTAYTDILPQDKDGVPRVDVMQTGTFRIRPDSPRETPYFIANHMIAAGVTGKCTDDPSKVPDIRQYEAQDLVAATFLKIYTDNPDIDPKDAKAQACERWYGPGYAKGDLKPNPPDDNDKRVICTLAQMDLFFEPNPPRPKYNWDEAWERCKDATQMDNPCFGNIKPTKEESN